MRLLVGLMMLFWSGAALAEVKQVDAGGFESVHDIALAQSPQQVWDALRAPARWWDKDHSYTGDSANLYLDAQAGGCFCEKLPERGSIEHLRVIYAQPGKQLRMSDGLGPLQSEPVAGVMTWTLKAGQGGGTRLGMTYIVSGRIRMEGGFTALAPLVDGVLAQQIAGLKAVLETPAP